MLDFLVVTVLLIGAGALMVGLAWGVIGLRDGTARRGGWPAVVGAALIGVGMAVPVGDSIAEDPLDAPVPMPQPPLPPPGMPPPPHMDGPPPIPEIGPDRLQPRPGVATHLRRACAVDAAGTASCWGEPTPDLNAGGARIVQVAPGREHACALRTDGRVFCVGDGAEDQTRAPPHHFTQIAAGNDHTCGLTEAGGVHCWGRADARIAAPTSLGFTDLSVGAVHSCGVDAEGAVHCWGCVNDASACAAPEGVFSAVSAGHRHTCALTLDASTPVCWGEDEAGQSTVPTGLSLKRIAAGWTQTCGLTQAGAIACWGCDGRLQRMLPAHADHCTPPAGAYAALSGGDLWGACAITAGGEPRCWGGLARVGGPR
jgi:hypothetical protein